MFCLRNRALPAVWLVVCACSLSAQSPTLPLFNAVQQFRDQGGRFQPVSPFAPAASPGQDAALMLPSAQFLHLDAGKQADMLDGLTPAVSLEIPFHEETLILDLVEANISTPDFSVITSQSGGQAVAYRPGRHYRGVVRGDSRSLAAVSFCQGEVAAIISDNQHGNLVLGKLDVRDNNSSYILYPDAELPADPPFSCAVLEPERITPKPFAQEIPEVTGCVRVYFEVDNELFINKGSVQATLDYLTSVFNQVAALYANEQINITLSQVFVWVTPDNYSTSSSSSALSQFRSLRKDYNGDIAHLVSIGGNNLGGIAYLDVLCAPSYAYGFSDINTSFSTVPTYSWTVEVLTHEMGHNLGSPHTQSCSWPGGPIDNCFTTEGGCSPGPPPVNGGTIMSYCHLTNYGINFNNGFGPLPGNKIRTKVANAACLSASCAPASGCTAPSGLSASDITGTNATIAWNTVPSANGYTLQWRPLGTASWTTIDPVTSPYTLSGLPANNMVEIRLKSRCGSSSSEYSYGLVFTSGSGSTGGGGTTCLPPATLNATATTTTSASVNWSSVPGATAYQLSYKASSSTAWSTPASLISTAYTLTQLTAGTSYQVRVSTVCTGASSGYATATFTTPSGGSSGSTCTSPANLKATNATASSAILSWDAVSGTQYYEIRYRPSTSTVWSNAIPVNSTAYVLTGLTANTAYYVMARSICSAGASLYIKILFTTPGSGGGDPGAQCPVPANFSLKSVTATSAVVQWGPVTGATGYDLQIKQATSSSWMTFLNLPATVVQITNMKSGTAYEVRVRARCTGTNNYSVYTNILSINTLNNFVSPPADNALFAGVKSVQLPGNTPDNAEQAALEIFPNPTNGLVTLYCTASNPTTARVEVTDLNGRLICSEALKNSDMLIQLALQEVPNGVYLVRLFTDNTAPLVKRLVKN